VLHFALHVVWNPATRSPDNSNKKRLQVLLPFDGRTISLPIAVDDQVGNTVYVKPSIPFQFHVNGTFSFEQDDIESGRYSSEVWVNEGMEIKLRLEFSVEGGPIFAV